MTASQRETVVESGNYKLKIYIKRGYNRGCLHHEEYFDTLEEMEKRYDKLFVYGDFGLNPTKWILDDGDWRRLPD